MTGSLTTRALDVDDLAKVVADVGIDALLDELIARTRAAIAAFDPSDVTTMVRAGFSYQSPELGLIEWMPAMRHGSVAAVKTVGYHPANPETRHQPSVLATTALYDTTSGHLFLLCESTFLTALRTGVASAVMTDELAVKQPIRLGVVGAGAQAVTQIHAISRIRELSEVVVHDPRPHVARSLADRVPALAEQIRIVDRDSMARQLDSVDVLCTATSVGPGSGPVIPPVEVAPHLHINAVGADFPGKTELPVELLRRAVVIPDVLEQCIAEGECQQLDRRDIGPDMVSVLAGRASSNLATRLTVFDSTGWAYEDLLAAELFADHADRLGLGQSLHLFPDPTDPYDPYEIVRL